MRRSRSDGASPRSRICQEHARRGGRRLTGYRTTHPISEGVDCADGGPWGSCCSLPARTWRACCPHGLSRVDAEMAIRLAIGARATPSRAPVAHRYYLARWIGALAGVLFARWGTLMLGSSLSRGQAPVSARPHARRTSVRVHVNGRRGAICTPVRARAGLAVHAL